MNSAAVASNIERNCQQTEIGLSKMLLQICGLLHFWKKCSFTRTSYATNMLLFTKKYSPLWKECCLHKIQKLLKKGHYSKRASFHFFMNESTPHFERLLYLAKNSLLKERGGEWRKATHSRKTKKLEKFQKTKKTSRKPKKTKKTKNT